LQKDGRSVDLKEAWWSFDLYRIECSR